MRCPYCVAQIADEALACPQCRRDLFLLKPLLEKIERLEQTLTEHGIAVPAAPAARIAALEQELAELKQATATTAPVNVETAEEKSASASYAVALVRALAIAFVLLVTAHGVLLFVYDAKPLYLRIASILIPIPFGFLLATRHPGRLWKSVGCGFAAALAAVWAMLVVTATFDKVPVLPQDLRDLRETIEYIVSIGLAFTTGFMLGELLPAVRKDGTPPRRASLLVARAFTPGDKGAHRIENVAKWMDTAIKIAAPAATITASVYAGVKSLLDRLV